jgi:hypothetical protein
MEEFMTMLEVITKADLNQLKEEMFVEMKRLLQPAGSLVAKRWIKSVDVRRMLDISPGTLQNLRVNGTLSYTKVGGTMFYKIEDIEQMLEKNSIQGRIIIG